jgi:hypothetical protein
MWKRDQLTQQEGMDQLECHFGCLSYPSKKERVGWKLGKDQLTQKEGIGYIECHFWVFLLTLLTVNLGLVSVKYKNPYYTYITVTKSRHFIIGSKCFHKRCFLFTVGNIYPENSSYN